MNNNFVDQIIANKTHCFFVSPHLDDAIFSAGGLISKLAGKTKITVINVFTSCGDSNSTLSAKAYLKQCGYIDKEKLFADRVGEDKAIFAKLGVEVVNLGEVDALWRKKRSVLPKKLGMIIPELCSIYPTYKFHIARGKLSRHDSKLIMTLSKKIERLLPDKNYFVFSPFGIGNHVDHILVKEVILKVAPQDKTLYWSDFPYSIRTKSGAMICKKYNVEKLDILINLPTKVKLCKSYTTQFSTTIKDKLTIPSHETYFQFKKNFFPKEIHNFTYIKAFQAEDDMSNYSFALYQDSNGKEYFVKNYHGTKKTRAYNFLQNEINVYKFLNKSEKNHKIIVPKLYWVEETESDLFMVIEYISGNNFNRINSKQKVIIFEKVINFFNSQKIKNISPGSPIMTRGPLYWIVILLISSIQIIISQPSLLFMVFNSLVLASKGIPAMLKRKERGLIHRDFNDHNIIFKNDKMYPIDFQLTSIADPLLERAILYFKYYNHPDMIKEITRSPELKNILDDEKQYVVYRTYKIIIALYDQMLPDGDHKTTTNFLKNLVNNIS